MGAIRNAIKSFDGTAEAKQEMEIQLDNMTALANAKADYFDLALRQELANAGSGSSKDIPVSFIIGSTRQTHAYAESSMDSIATTVTSAIDDFIRGGNENVLKGVGSLMTKGIQALFASKEGGENESHFLTVFAEGRALVRLDLKAWKRYTNIKSISTSAEQISAFVMVKSTIDASALDYNTFIQLYQNNLFEKATGFTSQEIEQQLDDIQKIYQKFKENQTKSKLVTEKLNELNETNQYIEIVKPSPEELKLSLDNIKEKEALLNW